MTTPGFAGKILLVNLSNKEIRPLDTEKYEAYGGGHGTSTALFWEYCVAPGDWDLQDAFHPRNMVSLMTGAVSGTGTPWGARTSVSGLSPQCYPIQWFSHSNFGSMFSTFMKMAGWDGVAVIGRAESPVYINIVDDKVTIEDAKDLWGLTTWECQEEIWKRTGVRYGQEWQEFDGRYTLQRPAIVTIGPAGENMTRVASLVHGGGSGAGQGGFGGVFGSKNLKAIAVIGTKGIKIADPKGLRDAREWHEKNWPSGSGFGGFGGQSIGSACIGCGHQRKCHNRDRVHSQDSDDCAESTWFSLTRQDAKGLDPRGPEISKWNRKGTDIVQQLGINGMETCFQGPMAFPTTHNPDFPIQPEVPAYSALGWYMKKMYDMGVIGPGTKYDMAPLNMDKFPSQEFMEIYGIALANRYGIGDLLAEGTARFCEKLGRKDDFNTLCRQTMWGYMDHWSMPGVDWAYGNLMDSRDINSHDMGMSNPSGGPFGRMGGGDGKKWTCEDYVKVLAERTTGNNHLWFDFSWEGKQAYDTGIFSKHKAEFVAWRQHYWTYYKESVGYCDWGYARLFSAAHPKGYGHTPEAEPRYLNAVTGRNHTFQDGLEIGRRAWNLKRAIFALQGRHKNMEKFTGYYYKPGASYCGFDTEKPIFDGNKWEWKNCRELYFTEEGVENWKTHFYDIEGWDKDSGYPKRKTLEDLGMKHVADLLQSRNKLGTA
jgi:aldehyde:ferredoxin oxidoreductase